MSIALRLSPLRARSMRDSVLPTLPRSPGARRLVRVKSRITANAAAVRCSGWFARHATAVLPGNALALHVFAHEHCFVLARL